MLDTPRFSALRHRRRRAWRHPRPQGSGPLALRLRPRPDGRLALFREHSDSSNEADTLANLAETHQVIRHPALAREARQQALALYQAQNRHAQAQRILTH